MEEDTATVAAKWEKRITTKGRAIGLILSKVLERKTKRKNNAQSCHWNVEVRYKIKWQGQSKHFNNFN